MRPRQRSAPRATPHVGPASNQLLLLLLVPGYIEAFEVPPGARNVVIAEVSASKNFIGIGSTSKPAFYLNGRRCVRHSSALFPFITAWSSFSPVFAGR